MDTPRNTLPDRALFESMYAAKAPWDIGKPQRPFALAAERVTGSVLDAGCGTGDTALFFAARGHRVTGFDFLEEPIRRARAKAAERGLSAEFLKEYSLPRLCLLLIQARVAALCRLPRMLRKRRQIRNRRAISVREWYGLISRFKLDAIELALKF